jgi:hypothetical protein
MPSLSGNRLIDLLDLDPGSFVWISEPPSKTNATLLTGSKALLQGIYTYAPDAPDYLPTSYTNQNIFYTDYVKHSLSPSRVTWAPAGETQVVWKSIPSDSPKWWSGKVTMAELVRTADNSESPQVFTDCSGFITSLFAYANIVESPTIFVDWKVGSIIPEAGCFNPNCGCNKPANSNYYHLFTSGQEGGFQSISLEDLKPGDLIAYAKTENKDESGHIMLVAAISSLDSDFSSQAVVVIDVIDNKSLHDYDTRKTRGVGGVGMGIAKLVSQDNNTLELFWELNSVTPEIGSIALGRTL